MIAKALKRPVYVAAESYKFARLFPLNQHGTFYTHPLIFKGIFMLIFCFPLLYLCSFLLFLCFVYYIILSCFVIDLPESVEEQSPFRPVLLSPSLASSSNPVFPTNCEYLNPRVDYTPPEFITLLFTDLGILTPSAVSDELIKLYY